MKPSHFGPALLALLLAGCSGSASDLVGPREWVEFFVSAAPAGDVPGSPVVVSAFVLNRGRDPIRYFEGCTRASFSFTVAGPSGPVHAIDPCAPIPLCAGRLVGLPRHGSIAGDFHFDGTLFREPTDTDAPCAPYVAPAGDYTVRARFFYSPAGVDGTSHVLERDVTFHWAGPARRVPAK